MYQSETIFFPRKINFHAVEKVKPSPTIFFRVIYEVYGSCSFVFVINTFHKIENGKIVAGKYVVWSGVSLPPQLTEILL